MDDKDIIRFKKMVCKEDAQKLYDLLDDYGRLKKMEEPHNCTRFDTIKEERKDSEFSLIEEQKVHELAILNDTLALIYDYISEKK